MGKYDNVNKFFWVDSFFNFAYYVLVYVACAEVFHLHIELSFIFWIDCDSSFNRVAGAILQEILNVVTDFH